VSTVQAIFEQYRERHDSVIIPLTAVAGVQGAPLATPATASAAGAAACRRENDLLLFCLVGSLEFMQMHKFAD